MNIHNNKITMKIAIVFLKAINSVTVGNHIIDVNPTWIIFNNEEYSSKKINRKTSQTMKTEFGDLPKKQKKLWNWNIIKVDWEEETDTKQRI